MSWLRRQKKNETANLPPTDRSDLPPVVTTTTIGHASHGHGGARLGSGSTGGGGGWGIRAGDLTDFILPVILIGGVLMYTERGCKWRPDLADYTPARAIPSMSTGGGGASWGSSSGGGGSRPAYGYSTQPSQESRRSEERKREASKKTAPSVEVVLDVEVDEKGVPQAVRVVRGAGGSMDERAIREAKRMRYQAAKRGGVAESSHLELTLAVPLY